MNDAPVVRIDAPMLAAAFPREYQDVAKRAAVELIGNLALRYWWGQSTAQVQGETVLIPVRLHFLNSGFPLSEVDDAWLFTRALKTRSTDRYLRQRALRDLLHHPQPWAAPFIVALVGGYVIQILDDIFEALTPELEQSLRHFIRQNTPLWNTTKRRVTSYWNAYYRRQWGGEVVPVFSPVDYVGFKIVNRLEASASRQHFVASL